MKYQHLKVEEREEIQRGMWRRESIRSIARRLGRSHASISREVARVTPVVKMRYNSRRAHVKALKQRTRRGRQERLKNPEMRAYVVSHLKLGWSPEQIAGRLKLEGLGVISHEAIYQFVYARIKNGRPRRGCEDLRPYLRRARRRRLPHGARQSQRISKPKYRSIEDRPIIVATRERFGDWESDTVVSCGHKPGVNTTLERKSGMFFVTKLAGSTSADTVRALAARFALVPATLRQTLTVDNGAEWADWRGVEEAAGMPCYAAHPYCSGERGSNENTNGLLREYFPKGTDFTAVAEAEIAKVEYALNTRPRKRLGWKMPLEIWSGAVGG